MYPLVLIDLIRTIYDSRAKLLHSPMGQLLNYLDAFGAASDPRSNTMMIFQDWLKEVRAV